MILVINELPLPKSSRNTTEYSTELENLKLQSMAKTFSMIYQIFMHISIPNALLNQ